MDLHHNLKEAYYILTENENECQKSPSSREQSIIQSLQDKLIDKQMRLSLTKEKYIKMRNSQIKECKEMAKIVEENQERINNSNKVYSTTTSSIMSDHALTNEIILWAGYWKSTISQSDIKQIFLNFGNIKNST